MNHKKSKSKRFLSVLLSVLMLVTTIPLAVVPASASTQEDAFVGYDTNKLNHTLNYTYGRFEGDSSSWNSEAQYLSQWKSVIWTDGVVKGYENGNNSYDSGWKTTGSGWNGSMKIAEHFYNHSAVVVYDGTSDMKMPVAIMSCADKTGTWASWGRLGACYLRNSDGITLETRWRTSNNESTNTLDVQWLLNTQSPLVAIRDKGNSWRDYDDGSGEWHQQSQGGRKFYATRLQFPALANNVYSKTFTLSYTYAHATGTSDTLTKVDGTSTNDPIYMVNYEPVKDAIAEAKTAWTDYKNDIAVNPGKYTDASMKAFTDALDLLAAANPSSFITSSNSKNNVSLAVSSYATAAKKAVDAWNAAKTLQVASYTVTFKNGYTTDTISSSTYKYGETPTAPSFQITKQTSGTKHSSAYEWIPAISAVTGNAEYTQNVKSWESCDFSQEQPIKAANCHEQGSKKQTCSVCGNERTVPIATNPNNHVGDEELRDVKAATCTEKGYTGDMYCLGCGNVKTSGSATDALGHDWGEWVTTVEPKWDAAGSKTRTCKRDSSHTETVDIDPLGDHDLPTATATVVIDNVEHDNNSLTTDPEKFYPAKNDKITVKIKAADATSGIKEVYRATSRTLLTPDDVAGKGDGFWTKVNVDENGSATLNQLLYNLTTSDVSYVVYFKIVDNAGKFTYVNTPMVVFDVTDPTITLTGIGKADKTEFCLTVNVAVTDTNLKTVTVNGEEKTLENGRFTADLTAGTYTVVATDMTGNSATKTFTVNKKHNGGTATCQNHATCEVCGQGYGEKNPNIHVDLTDVKGKPATCTEDGWTDYKVCKCGVEIGKTLLPKYDHDQKRYVPNGDGTHRVVCDRCSETIETNVACVGDETVGYKAATCTEPAKREHECANCHYKYWVNEEGSFAKGHFYNLKPTFNWTEIKDAEGNVTEYTCDKATFECSVCHEKVEVDATCDESISNATCIADGAKTYSASASFTYSKWRDDGAEYSVVAEGSESKEVTLPALGHQWGDVSFVWNTAEDGTVSCTASRTCANGHTDPLDVTLTHEQTTVPTCTIKEVVTYTAEVTVDGAKKTATYEVEGAVDSTNHSYVDAVTPPTCTTDGYTTHTCSACRDTYIDSKVGMLGHDWDNPVFTWADDNTCTATRTCKRAGCGTEEDVDVVVTYATTTPATCTEKEVVTYTATATIGDKNYTSTKDVIGEIDPNNHDWQPTGTTPATCMDDAVNHFKCSRCDKTEDRTVENSATGHNWDTKNATFTWTKTEDGKSYTATATRKCLNDEKHTETVDAVVTGPAIDPDATCETPGTATFTATATFSDDATATGTKTEPVSALGHNYGKAEFDWTTTEDGGFTATKATKTCGNNGEHKLEADAVVTVEVTATCTKAGKKIYTATAKFGNETVTDSREVEIGALGHDWNEPTFDWTADKDSATLTVTFKCNNDDTHTKTVTVDADKIKRTEEVATCTADGKVTYTVEGFTFEGKAYDVPAKDVTLKKLGHAYGDYTIADADRPTKNADGTWTNGTLKAVCANGCGIVATQTIGRADYTKYEKAWNDLVALRDRDDVNAEIKAEIQAVLDANVVAQNLVALENEQKTIDDATARLVYEFKEAEKKISYTVTFKDEDGNVVYTELVLKGEDVKNVPAVPEKAPDKDNHYNGKWNGATTNIQFNETVHAVYTSEAHRGGTATCVSGRKCEVCGTVYTDASQDGHDWELHFFWAKDYSTCEAKLVCKNCGFVTVEVLDAKVTKVENPATCTAEGSITYTATVSYQGETRTSVRTETLKPTGHKYGKVEFHWDADHNCKAWKTCASCGNRLMADNVDVVYSKVERTCEIEGFDVYTATATFGTETFENVKKISLGFAEHQFGETYLIKESTCTEQGLKGRKCSVCGAVTAEKLPLKEHQPKTIPGYAATCTKAGLTDGIICAECSYAIKAQEIIPALGHIDENNDGVCDRCGTYLGVKPPVEPENDGCICHREGNIFGKIIRIICTVLSGVFHKDIKCCPDMEWWSTKKG